MYKSLKSETFIKAPRKPIEKPIEPDPKDRPRKYPDENKWIWDMLVDIKLKLTEGIKPLEEYLVKFSEYKEVLKLNPDEYVHSMEMDENPPEIEKI